MKNDYLDLNDKNAIASGNKTTDGLRFSDVDVVRTMEKRRVVVDDRISTTAAFGRFSSG